MLSITGLSVGRCWKSIVPFIVQWRWLQSSRQACQRPSKTGRSRSRTVAGGNSRTGRKYRPPSGQSMARSGQYGTAGCDQLAINMKWRARRTVCGLQYYMRMLIKTIQLKLKNLSRGVHGVGKFCVCGNWQLCNVSPVQCVTCAIIRPKVHRTLTAAMDWRKPSQDRCIKHIYMHARIKLYLLVPMYSLPVADYKYT